MTGSARRRNIRAGGPGIEPLAAAVPCFTAPSTRAGEHPVNGGSGGALGRKSDGPPAWTSRQGGGATGWMPSERSGLSSRRADGRRGPRS